MALLSAGLLVATGCNGYGMGSEPTAVTIAAPSNTVVAVGTSITLTAAVKNDTNHDGVVWTLVGTGCTGTACGTLSSSTTSSVVFTEPQTTTTPLSVSITATSLAYPSIKTSIALSIPGPPPITIALTPSVSSTVNPGSSLALKAVLTNDTTSQGVAWSISGTGCSGTACGTLSNITSTSVTYTAPMTMTAISVVVTATSVAQTNVSASVTLAVPALPPVIVAITPPSSTVVTDGSSLALTAVVTNDIAADGVTWSLSGTGCTGATCGVLSKQTSTTVNYTAPSTDAALTVIIQATSVAEPSVSASITLSVPAQLHISLTPTILPPAIVGQSYSQTIQASNGVAPYTITPTNLPAWVTVTITSNSITLAGTPAATDVGTFNMKMSVADSASPNVGTNTTYIALTTYSAAGTSNALLTGSYAFYGSGFQDGATTAATTRIGYIGSFTADGNGNITAGELDVNGTNGLISYTGLTGTYTVQANQTGKVTLLPSGALPITLAIGVGGIQSSVATTGQFAEFDDSTGIGGTVTATSSGVRISGEMTQQLASVLKTSTTPISGSYAFGMAGGDPSVAITAACELAQTCGPISSAGAITFVSGGVVSTGEEDVAIGSTSVNQVALSGALSNSGNTDMSGRVTATVSASGGSLLDWPKDFVLYMVNPQTFYVMSTDSHANTSLLSGKAEQQNLAGIASTPFTSGKTLIMWGNSYGSSSVATPANGTSLAEISLLTTLPTNATTGKISNLFVYTGDQGTTSAVRLATDTYKVEPNGRVTISGSFGTAASVPELYLVDTGQGFATQQPASNTEAAGMLEFQPQIVASLNSGNYTGSVFKPATPLGATEAGILTLPAGGLPSTDTTTYIPTTGEMFANFADLSDAGVNTTLLLSQPLTGEIKFAATPGQLVLYLAPGGANSPIQDCGFGGFAWGISASQFVCFSGSKKYGWQELLYFQQ